MSDRASSAAPGSSAASRPTCVLRDGVIAEVGAGRVADAGDARSLDADGLVALPGLVDLHTHLREPGREDAETVETGTARRRARRLHRRARDGQHRPGRRHRRRRRAGVAAGPRGRARATCSPVGAVTVGLAGEQLAELGAMADSAARVRVFSDDGQCVSDAGADAPRAGVRQGVRRRHRPARPGAAAHRGRPDERGRAVRRARAARLAGGRRGGDHRPRRAARRARRLPAARLPRVDRRLGRDRPLGQGARASTSPPRSPRTTCCSPTTSSRSYDPVYKVNPPLRTADDVEALREAPRRRHDRHRRHRPRAARRSRTRTASGRRPRSGCSACETALGVVDRDDGRRPGCSTGPASPTGCRSRPARDRPRWPATAARSPSGEPANLVARRPGRALDRRPGRAGRPQPQHPVRRARRCRRRVVATFLRGRADRARRQGRGIGDEPTAREPRRVLVLEDGRTFRGEAYGARRRDVRRGGVLHRHDRLPGDADRPVLPPPGRGA